MPRKRFHILSLLAMLMVPSLVMATAIPWTIDTDGNLTITESGKHYHVTQRSNTPVRHWIKVNDGVATTITLDGVHLSNKVHSSMDLGNHKETMTTIILKGENSLNQEYVLSRLPALRMAHGTLRIEGDGKLEASTDLEMGDAAAIGSGLREAMQGTIQIAGKTQITVSSDLGAGIGSGVMGDMSGTIQIMDQARVTMYMLNDPGIGSGLGAEMSGEVQISGQAQVKIQSYSGRGIGAELQGYFRGKIDILDKVQLTTKKVDRTGTPTGEPAAIGGGHHFTTDAPNGHYKISTEATINGIKAENAQVLIDKKLVNIHMKDGKAQNYEAVEPPPEPEPPTPPAPKKVVQFPTFVGLRTLRGGKVSIGPVGPQTTGFLEEATSAFASLEGPVLYQGKLRFVGEDPAQAFVLSFHLGSEYAGKTVQIQQNDRGQSQAYTVLVSEAGLASVPVRTLGDFAVTVQP